MVPRRGTLREAQQPTVCRVPQTHNAYSTPVPGLEGGKGGVWHKAQGRGGGGVTRRNAPLLKSVTLQSHLANRNSGCKGFVTAASSFGNPTWAKGVARRPPRWSAGLIHNPICISRYFLDLLDRNLDRQMDLFPSFGRGRLILTVCIYNVLMLYTRCAQCLQTAHRQTGMLRSVYKQGTGSTGRIICILISYICVRWRIRPALTHPPPG